MHVGGENIPKPSPCPVFFGIHAHGGGPVHGGGSVTLCCGERFSFVGGH